MRKLLALAAMPFLLTGTPAQAQLNGSMGIAENTCVLPISTFVFQNCGYTGAANIVSDLTAGNVWIGPLLSGGFYTSIAATPGFTLSTQTGVSDTGTPLTSFLVRVPESIGNGKVTPSITGNISVAASVVSGSFTIGAGARNAGTGNSLAGGKAAYESWTSITHTLTAKLADSVIGGNAFGGSDYIIGSNGFPTLLCAGTGGGGAGDCFGGESVAVPGLPPAVGSPWIATNGGNGPFAVSLFDTTAIEIVSYDVGFILNRNVGTITSATISGHVCSDTGLDPKEPGSPADTVSDCVDSPVVWGSTATDAVRVDGASNASFDNLLLKVSTDSGGNVVAVDGFYVLQYSIISPGYNSWVGGTLSFSGEPCTDCEPPPPPSPPPSVYAVTGASGAASTLYELDRDTAALIRTVGPTGRNYITAMDFHPLTGELYAIAQDTSTCCPFQGDLLTLDLDTGSASVIARTGAFTDMGFHPDGRLFGNGRPFGFGDQVFQIDIQTGAYTAITDFGNANRPGISFDALGIGRTKDFNSIYAFDPDIPSTSFLRNISGNTLLNTLEFDQNNILLGVTDFNLVTIDVNAGTQTNVGPVFNRYAALASQPIPCFEIDAIDDQFTLINDGTPADLNVLGNDACRSDRPISVVALAGDLVPDQGGSAITAGSTVTYTPPGGLVGPESFTYTAQDAGLDGGDDPPSVDQDTATVTVNLLEDLIPDAVDDEVDILQSQTVFIDVLDNDTLGNPANVVTIETAPANGSATVEADSRIRYFPDFMFFGPDSFEYRITDANGDTDVATVNVGVFFTSGRVPIDIMPGKEINNINLQAGGRIQVAILSVGEFFDAPAIVDPFTLKLGLREANIIGTPQVRDIDSDGDDDLLVKFLIEQTGIPCGAPATNLTGRTFTGGFIVGDDSINTFRCRRRPITY
jgi:hypothetical protein